MILSRLFTISRGSSHLISMSHLYISISVAGLLLILHSIYYGPLLNSKPSFSIYSILYSLLTHTVIKVVVFFVIKRSASRHIAGQKMLSRKIGFIKLIYTSIIKIWTYVNFILLLTTLNYLSLSLAIICTLLLVIFLQFAKINNRIARVMNKGKSFETNVKIAVVLLLAIISIALQPVVYEFNNELHFEIFIIFTFCLLIFSYYYLHKLAFAITVKQTALTFLFQEACIELLCIILVISYYFLIGQNGLTLSAQFSYIAQKWYIFALILILSVLNQIIFIQFFKKVAYCRSLISQATGFLWLNVYGMIKKEINMFQYVSVIVMVVVVLMNVQLISEDKIKRAMQWFFRVKSKKVVLHEQSQMKDEQVQQ